MIGPWSHSGFLDNRVGHVQSGKRSRFNHLTHAISFFDRCLGRQTDADTMDELAEADAADSAAGEALCLLPPKYSRSGLDPNRRRILKSCTQSV